MIVLQNPAEALAAITSFLASHLLDQPEAHRSKLLEVGTSPDRQMAIVNMGELIYARRADLTDEAKMLGAQLAWFGGSYDLHYYKEGRGFGMSLALRRDAGDEPPAGAEFPAPEDDPDVREEWLPPAEPEPDPE